MEPVSFLKKLYRIGSVEINDKWSSCYTVESRSSKLMLIKDIGLSLFAFKWEKVTYLELTSPKSPINRWAID